MVTECQKTQAGRMWSIFLASPLLIVIALMPKMDRVARVILISSGILLIFSAGFALWKNTTYKNDRSF